VLRRMGLAGRLLALVGLGTVITLGAFGLSAYLAVRDSNERQLDGRLALAEALSAQTEHALQQSLGLLQQVAFLPEVNLQDDDLGPEKRALEQAYFSSVFTGGVYLLDQRGDLIWREPPADADLVDGAALPHVVEALESGKPTVSGVYRDPVNDREVVSAALPIRDASGTIAAVIGGDIDLLNSDLQRMATATGLGEAAGDIQIIDSEGVILASTVPEALLSEASPSSHLATMIASGEPVVDSCRDCRAPADSPPREQEIVAVVPMSVAPWSFVLWEGETDVLGPVQSLRMRFVIFGVVIFVVASMLAWALAQSVVRPVTELTDAAQDIAGGQLDEPITISGQDEIGRLGQALDTMRLKLRNSLTRIRHWNRELEERVRKRTRELEASRNDLEATSIENSRLYEELQKKEALRSELLRKVISVQEEERRRIARELHDETSQALTALILSLETTSQAVPPDGAALRNKLHESETVARGLLENVHRLIFDLRPSVLDDLGLVAAIRWYAETRLEPMGTRVHLETEGDERRLPSPIETAIFRVAQEALTNVARHAEAENVAISLSFQNGMVRVEVEDDGKGFDVAAIERGADSTRGLGLLGMRERVGLLDGSVAIDSEPNSGTAISIEVPVPPEGEAVDGH
jgi:signal transduction histidine kinase